MKRFTISAAAMLAALLMVTSAQAVTTVVNWTGTSGASWEIGLNFNGGPALTHLGRNNGWRETDGIVSDPIITLSGAAASGIVYDAELLGDFHLRSDNGGTGLLKIEAGGTLNLRSGATVDGVWTHVDAKGITVTGIGSELSRTTSVASNNGGAFVWGSWQNDPGEKIDIKVLDFGTLENEGQIWFGAYNDSAPDLEVTLEIGEGAKVNTQGALQGGISLDNTAGAEGEINFIYNWDPDGISPGVGATDDSTYAIDFVGDGLGNHGSTLSVPVGPAGIRVQEETAPTVWTSTQKTYTELWDDGLLLYDGKDDDFYAGLAIPKDFDDFFKETTELSAPIVTEGVEPPMFSILTSIGGAVEGGSNPGDINGDFLVNAVDAGTMFANWSFTPTPGKTLAEGNLNGSADGINAADAGVMFAAWSFDPGPALPGDSLAEYDPATGEIVVSITGVNNWYIESASGSLTGDAPSHTAIIAGSLPSDTDNIIGETGFAVATGTDVSLGNVAALGLQGNENGDLKIFWNAGLGQPVEWAWVTVVPEPTTLALAAFSLCGVLTTRRRVPVAQRVA